MPESASRTAPTRLKEARRRLYSSTAAFAERLGVASVTYASHERGTRAMDLDTIERYAAALRISPGWLAFGEGSGGPDLPAMLRAAADRLEAAEHEAGEARAKLTAARKALG